jgi:hypothetical protein
MAAPDRVAASPIFLLHPVSRDATYNRCLRRAAARPGLGRSGRFPFVPGTADLLIKFVFGNYSDPQPEICLGREHPCVQSAGATAMRSLGPDPSLPGTGTYSSLRRAPTVAD